MSIDGTLLRRLIPLAEEHGGIVSVSDAERAGVSNRMLLHYAAGGDLERVLRGIYRLVWLPRHRFADVIAACLRVGDDAVAVGETAAAVWGLGDAMPARITICSTRSWRGTIPGARVITCTLEAGERTIHDAVPVTSLGRTLADLFAADPARGRAALATARRTGLLAERELRRLGARYPALASTNTSPGATE